MATVPEPEGLGMKKAVFSEESGTIKPLTLKLPDGRPVPGATARPSLLYTIAG